MKKISHGGNIYKKAKEMGIREETGNFWIFPQISARLACRNIFARQ